MIELPNQAIQQIIPVQGDIHAKGFDDDGVPYIARIVCYALVKDKYGDQSIVPMMIDGGGYICPAPFCIIDPVTEELDRKISN